MELIERLKNLNSSTGVGLTGIKKLTWYNSEGKEFGLISFGKKQDIIVPLDDYKWKTLQKVTINKEDSIDLGDILVWLKNDYYENQRILEYGLLSTSLYLQNPKTYWLDPTEIDGKNRFTKLTQEKQNTFRGKILYTKKNAGFFVFLLGNWYFLPKGESLTFYKPGIWKSNYGAVVTKIGLYLEGLTNFLYSDFLKKVNFEESLEKANKVAEILEGLLLHELNHVFYKGSKRNRRASKVRSRALLAYSYFLYTLMPLLNTLNRLKTLADKAGLDSKELNILLKKGVEEYEKTLDQDKELYEICMSKLKTVKTLDEFYYYLVYSKLLSVKNQEVPKFTLDRSDGVKVTFSKTLDNKDLRKLTSVSRRALL